MSFDAGPAQENNVVELRREIPSKGCLDKYRAKRASYHNAAAAKLWMSGVPLSDARRIVADAFREAITD